MAGTNKEEKVDLAIIGCGPAGLSAAVNAKMRNVDFELMGVEFCSSRMASAPEINNYLGFHNVSGEELKQEFMDHIQKLDIEINKNKVENIYNQEDSYAVLTRNKTLKAKSLVLGVGVSNEEYIEGEERLVGRGVSYCATCDGALYRDRDIAALVYTEEETEDIEYLAELANKIYLFTELDLEESFPANVEIIKEEPQAIEGENLVESVKLEEKTIDIEGVFVFRAVTPPDKLMSGLNTRDSHIEVDENMATNFSGVFAAGDCTGKPYQLGKAVGEGQIAALNAASYLRNLK